MGSLIGGIMQYYGALDSAQMNIDYQREANAQNRLIHNEDKAYNAEQSKLGRDFLASMATQQMNYNSSEADINRQFQSNEAEKAREFEKTMIGESISKSAEAYSRLGISPAAMLGGLGSTSSAPFGSGSEASVSLGGTAEANAPGAPTMVAPHVPNAMESLINAFSDLETATSKAQNTRLDSKLKEMDLKYADRQKELDLKIGLADLDKKLEDKKLTSDTRKKLEIERDQMQFELDLRKELREDLKQQTILETTQKAEQVKGMCLDNIAKRIQVENLPQKIAKEFNLMDSQAAACVKAAEAAYQSALASKYNAKTNRLQFRFDKKKYKEVYKANVESLTEANKAGAELDQRNTDAVTENQMIHIGEVLMHEYMESGRTVFKSVAGILDFF